MFKCKCCPEKELRITELKEQIAYFKTLLNPPERISKYELEEVAVFNGGGQQLVDEETLKKETEVNAALQREADGIFMGIYDEQYETPIEG